MTSTYEKLDGNTLKKIDQQEVVQNFSMEHIDAMIEKYTAKLDEWQAIKTEATSLGITAKESEEK